MGWLLVVVLPRIGNLGAAGPLLLDGLTLGHALAVIALLAVYLLAHARTLTVAVPELSLAGATLMRLVSGASSRIVPGGWTAGVGGLAAMLRLRGTRKEAIGHAIALTGVWNTLTKLSLPVLGMAATMAFSDAPAVQGWRTKALLATVVALALGALWLLGRERVVRWAGGVAERCARAVTRMLRRDPPHELGDRMVSFQRSTLEALRERPIAMVTSYYAYHLAQVQLLWVGMRAAAGPDGPAVQWMELFTAFGLGYLLTALPFSPGGLGTLDVAVVTLLVGLGEAPAVASAGIIVYRVTTYALYVPSLAAWPLWHRRFRDGS